MASKYCGNDNAEGNVVIKHKQNAQTFVGFGIWEVLVQILWKWDVRDIKGMDMECEGPQYLRCGMLEPSITTSPRVTIVSSSKYMYMTMPQ